MAEKHRDERLPKKFRKNAVRAIEFMITLSPGSLDSNKSWSYLSESFSYLQKRFGRENIIAASAHMDETTPHLSVIVLPIVDEKLNARKLFGGRDKCRQLQTEFWEQVGKKFGLDRGIEGSKAKHEDIKKYYATLKTANELLFEAKSTTKRLKRKEEKIAEKEEQVEIREKAVSEREIKTEALVQTTALVAANAKKLTDGLNPGQTVEQKAKSIETQIENKARQIAQDKIEGQER